MNIPPLSLSLSLSHTTVLTDGSDRLSWPVMSVGGYCCEEKERQRQKNKQTHRTQVISATVTLFTHTEGTCLQCYLLRQFRIRLIKSRLGCHSDVISDQSFINPPGYTLGCHFIRFYGDLFPLMDVVEGDCHIVCNNIWATLGIKHLGACC